MEKKERDKIGALETIGESVRIWKIDDPKRMMVKRDSESNFRGSFKCETRGNPKPISGIMT